MELSPLAASAFAGLLERRTGQQLAPGRRWRIETALAPLMRAHGIPSLDRLAMLVREPHPTPLGEQVVEALLNHETSFFRDAAAFRALRDSVLPALAGRFAPERRLRIWSAGCATGQETYSVALVAGSVPALAGWELAILGSDVSPQAVARAREALYSPFEIQRGLRAADMIAHFQAEGEQWRASPALRSQVAFRTHNLLDPPPGRFDLILCRNVLFYFAPARRREVLARLAEALEEGGVLMLGAGETVLGQSEAFVPDPALRGVYRLGCEDAR